MTLVESLLAAAILAAAILTITWPFVAAAQNQQVALRTAVAGNLAQEMMEEILLKPFADPDGESLPGPDPGESRRSQFDNVDDYDGYYEPPGDIESFDGEAMTDPAAEGLDRLVQTEYAYFPDQDGAMPPSVIRVTVRVRRHGDDVATLTRLFYWTECPWDQNGAAAEEEGEDPGDEDEDDEDEDEDEDDDHGHHWGRWW